MDGCSIFSWVLHGRLPNLDSKECEKLIQITVNELSTNKQRNKLLISLYGHRHRYDAVQLKKKYDKIKKEQDQMGSKEIPNEVIPRCIKLQQRMEGILSEFTEWQPSYKTFRERVKMCKKREKLFESNERLNRELIEEITCPHLREDFIATHKRLLYYQRVYQRIETDTNHSDSDYEGEIF